MKTSTEIGSIAKYVGEEKAIEYVAKAGFDAYDLSMFSMIENDWRSHTFKKSSHPFGGDDYKEFALRLKDTADRCGIICNQSHAPFPSDMPGIEKYLIRSLEITSIVGGKICIIHPCNDYDYKKNAEMYRRLLPYAKKYNVKIACENMWNWKAGESHASSAACSHHDDFKKHIDEVNDEYLVACLDIGHSEMEGLDTSAVKMIETLKNRIQALHIHDNDRHDDSHQIPFSMNIDFEEIVKALKDINYNGYFTLEADAYIGSKNGEDIFEHVKELQSSVRKLADMYERL